MNTIQNFLPSLPMNKISFKADGRKDFTIEGDTLKRIEPDNSKGKVDISSGDVFVHMDRAYIGPITNNNNLHVPDVFLATSESINANHSALRYKNGIGIAKPEGEKSLYDEVFTPEEFMYEKYDESQKNLEETSIKIDIAKAKEEREIAKIEQEIAKKKEEIAKHQEHIADYNHGKFKIKVILDVLEKIKATSSKSEE